MAGSKLYEKLGMSPATAEALYTQEGITSFKELQRLTPKRLKMTLENIRSPARGGGGTTRDTL